MPSFRKHLNEIKLTFQCKVLVSLEITKIIVLHAQVATIFGFLIHPQLNKIICYFYDYIYLL